MKTICHTSDDNEVTHQDHISYQVRFHNPSSVPTYYK